MIATTALLIIFGLFFLTVNAQDNCLPELLYKGKTNLKIKEPLFETDPCPLSADSSLIEAAVNEYFTPGEDIPRECSINVTEVKCKSKVKRMRGRLSDRERYEVQVEFYFKINCTTDPCIGAGFIIDQENGTSILMAEYERISTLTLDDGTDYEPGKKEKSRGKKGKSRGKKGKGPGKKEKSGSKTSETMLEVDGQNYMVEGNIKVNKKNLCAVCGNRVVGDVDIQYLSPSAKTKRTRSKKNEPMIDDILCGMYK